MTAKSVFPPMEEMYDFQLEVAHQLCAHYRCKQSQSIRMIDGQIRRKQSEEDQNFMMEEMSDFKQELKS